MEPIPEGAAVLRIDAPLYEDLRRHAEEAYPRECCGVLVGLAEGEDRRETRAVRCANVAAGDAGARYEIDPHDLLRVARAARERGEAIVAFHHSHPDHPARASPADLEGAWWPLCSYVITSVERGRAGETASFRLVDGEGGRRLEPEPVEVGRTREGPATAVRDPDTVAAGPAAGTRPTTP
jgi:proteasome lid subunit RPN8/RPN11